MHRRRPTMAMAVAVLALVGCASGPPAAPASASGGGPGLGWRKGVVMQAGDRDSLGPPIDSDCREPSRGNDPAARTDTLRRYVEVRYFVGRHAHQRIVPIDDAPEVVAGDVVWFRSFGCVSARRAPAAG